MKKLALARKPIDSNFAEAQIAEAGRRLKKLEPVYLYLFGSAVDGKLNDQSDLDFLLVFSNVQSLKAAQSKVKEFFPLCNMSVDLVWVTEEEFERKKSLGGICMEAYEFGVQLADQNLESKN